MSICAHIEFCSGCTYQLVPPEEQVAQKQAELLRLLNEVGDVTPNEVMPAIMGPVWGYRRKARLGVKYVHGKGLLVGFREQNKRFITDTKQCETLVPEVGHKISALREMIPQLSSFQKIPQIEVASGDDGTALIFRHLHALTDRDKEILNEFGIQHQFRIFLQSGGLKTVVPLNESDDVFLHYDLPAYGLTLAFHPLDFVQINREINFKLIETACSLLELNQDDQVLDLFCGLGNFSLPLATAVKSVVGIEGSEDMVERANYNAEKNNIHNASFYAADLFQTPYVGEWVQQTYTKILLDPPRMGAMEVVENLEQWSPERIVYVSCSALTFSRDANELVRRGYTLEKVGLVDMFPHTQHAEVIGLFLRA